MDSPYTLRGFYWRIGLSAKTLGLAILLNHDTINCSNLEAVLIISQFYQNLVYRTNCMPCASPNFTHP